MVRAQAESAVVHVDLDAFYAQVEQHRDPVRLLGKPTAVMQVSCGTWHAGFDACSICQMLA